MMELSIACPLCSQLGFPDVNTLWFTLIRATTRQLACPICHEVLCGLDKLTIHLVSHSLQDQLLQACVASNLLSAPSAFPKNTDLTSLAPIPSQDSGQATNSQSAPLASYVLINFPSVENAPGENGAHAIKEKTAIEKSLETGSTMSCPDTSLPGVVEFKAEKILSISNGTTPVVTQNVSSNCNETLEFLGSHPLRGECNYGHASPQTEKLEKPLSEWNQSASQYDLPRECGESSNSKFSSLCGSDPEPKSVTKEPLQNFPSQTSRLAVSCGICGLSFKDNNIAMLHQQLIHNFSPQNDNAFLQPSKTDERNALKQRPKRTNVSQSRDGAGSLHRYPCHICSKVFRMRGSLMVHLRVAHSPSGTAGLASRLGSSSSACSKPPLDVGKLPMQNLSLKDRKLSFTAQEEFHKTGITDQALFCQRASGFSNPLAVSKSGLEQLCVTSNQLPSQDSRSSKSPIASSSPSSSPAQSPISQVPSSEPIGSIYPCSLCNKTYSKEALLTQHLKSHESKQWECDVCFKSFTTKYFLKKHKRLHTGEMPYTCAICNKSFTFQQSYHKHLLYHSDEKPHSCNECGRAFKELSTLHNHQRIHTGEKPWACETCDVVAVCA